MRAQTISAFVTIAMLLASVPAHAGIVSDIRGKVGEAASRSSTPLPGESYAAPRAGAAAVATSADPPGEGPWRDYEFVPGERTIWFEDFSGDAPGAPPIHFSVAQGDFVIADLGGQRVLRSSDGGIVYFDLPEALPASFTVEVTYRVGGSDPIVFDTNTSHPPADSTCTFGGDANTAFVSCPGATVRRALLLPATGFVHARFSFEGDSARAWLEAERLSESGSARVPRTRRIGLGVPSGGLDDPVLIASLRIAERGANLEQAIADSGRAVTHGILFGTASDRILPESTPTLAALGRMLVAQPGLRLALEAHADDLGMPESNQSLSERRADAVRKFLVSAYHVDAARLETRGRGATRPLFEGPSTWASRENRRIEIVRL